MSSPEAPLLSSAGSSSGSAAAAGGGSGSGSGSGGGGGGGNNNVYYSASSPDGVRRASGTGAGDFGAPLGGGVAFEGDAGVGGVGVGASGGVGLDDDETCEYGGHYGDGSQREAEATHLFGHMAHELDPAPPRGSASFASGVFNTVNTIIGGGVLALPFVFSTVGIVLGACLLLGVAGLSAFSSSMIVTAAKHARCYSYKDLAKVTFGGVGGARIVDTCLIVFLLGACTGYVIIIGDMFSPFVIWLVNSGEPPKCVDGVGENVELITRLVMIGVATFVLFPLMTLRHIDSLKFTSVAALVCISFLVLCVFIRGVPRALEEADVEKKLVNFTPQFFAVLPVVSFAFTFHMNIFPVRNEMAKPSKVERVVQSSVVICGVVYISVATIGYLAFPRDLSDNILLAFPPDDILINLARGALGIIICFSYPLLGYAARVVFDVMVFSFRDRVAAARVAGPGNDPHTMATPPAPRWRIVAEAAGYVAITTILAIAVPNISFVFGFVGASVGNMVVYILPAIFYLYVEQTRFHRREADRALAAAAAASPSTASAGGASGAGASASASAAGAAFLSDDLDVADGTATGGAPGLAGFCAPGGPATRFNLYLRAKAKKAIPAIGVVCIGILFAVISLTVIVIDTIEGKYQPDVKECNATSEG